MGDGDGQGSLACCSLRGCKEPDMTEQMNNNKLHTCCACEHQLPCTHSAARAPAIQAAAPLPQKVLQCSLGSRDYGRLTYRGGENHNCTPVAVWLRKRINNISRSCISCGLNPHDQLGKLFVYLSLSSVAQSCLTLCDPVDCSMPGFPVHQQLLELTQTQAHRVSDAIHLSHPLSSPSPPAPNPSQHQSFPMSQLFA